MLNSYSDAKNVWFFPEECAKSQATSDACEMLIFWQILGQYAYKIYAYKKKRV